MSGEQCGRAGEAVEWLDKAGGFGVGLRRDGRLVRGGPRLRPRFSARLMSEEILESFVLVLFLMSFAMRRRAEFGVGQLSKYAQLLAAM
jgi:hypothetical protein